METTNQYVGVGIWGWIRPRLVEWLFPSREMERRLWPLGVGAAYICINAALGGLTPNHVYLGLLAFLDLYNEKSRKFLIYFLPFILTGVAFDSMRYYYWQGISGHVHVAEPYFRDLRWFGIHSELAHGARVTPNEFFALHSSIVLDLLCGFAYLVFVGEYLMTAFYLFFRERWEHLRIFGWCFFIVNVMGFITYFIYPAAPPWYVRQYGLGPARMDIQPSAAFASRFDQILGTHFFDQMYGHGIDVYGAYPSLHVTYPLIVCWAVFLEPELKWARLPAIGFYFLMCLSAVYLQHHYVVDILLGTSYAVVTLWAVRKWSSRKSGTIYENQALVSAIPPNANKIPKTGLIPR